MKLLVLLALGSIVNYLLYFADKKTPGQFNAISDKPLL